MADIIDFYGETCLDLSPEKVLDSARGRLQQVIIIGRDEEGCEYFASSIGDGPEILWLLKRAELYLLKDENNE